MFSFHVARRAVCLHRVPVILTLQQQGIAPETPDLFFVLWPVCHVNAKHGTQNRMPPHCRVKPRHNTLDLRLRHCNACESVQTTIIQTTMRLMTR